MSAVANSGILSPLLLQIFIDDLAHEGTDQNIGDEFKNVYKVNLLIIVYDDDIILICPFGSNLH